ncbi:MAG: ABC transporter permease subunit [Candidatus Hermodarchaeota archaeon]
MREIKSIHKNLIFTATIAIVIFFIGLVISFVFFKLLPDNPAIALLEALGQHDPSLGIIRAMEHQLGLDDPIFIQFFTYVSKLMIGDWGRSVSVVPAALVIDLVQESFPEMITMIFFPMTIGILMGISLGMISSRYRNKWEDTIIQIFCYFILAIPVFFIGLIFMVFYDTPTRIGIIPIFILTLATIAITALQARSYLIKKSNPGSIISFTSTVARTFGFFFMFYILVDNTFDILGFGYLIVSAFILVDFFLILAILFIMVIIIVLIITISNLLFILYRHLVSKGYTEPISEFSKPKSEIRNEEVNNEEKLKDYLLIRLKSPIFIIGTVLVVFCIILAIFPQLITQYSYDYHLVPHVGSWNPPSPDHPLGQTALGGDVLGRCMYGIRDAILFGIGAVIIGLIGGVNFGFVAGRFKPWGYKLIMTFMILFYLFPSFLFVILIMIIFNRTYFIGMLSIGIMLIPIFTRVTANAVPEEFNRKMIYKIGKSLITYIPINIAFAILLYCSVEYLGIYQDAGPRLGYDINKALQNPFNAPWAWFWPGLTVFMMLFSFFMLHLGLKGLGSIGRKRIKIIESE